MAGQGRVVRIELTIPATKNDLRQCLGIVAPQLRRHAAEELPGAHQTVQDRAARLVRQRNGKRVMTVRPDDDQHGNQPPAFGKVDMNVSEVTFRPRARRVVQQQVRLPFTPAPTVHVPAHLIIPARVTVLVPQAVVQPRRRVPLLARGRLVVLENLIDNGNERSKLGMIHRPRPRVPPRHRLRQRTADRLPPMAQPPGDLPDRKPVPVQ